VRPAAGGGGGSQDGGGCYEGGGGDEPHLDLGLRCWCPSGAAVPCFGVRFPPSVRCGAVRCGPPASTAWSSRLCLSSQADAPPGFLRQERALAGHTPSSLGFPTCARGRERRIRGQRHLGAHPSQPSLQTPTGPRPQVSDSLGETVRDILLRRDAADGGCSGGGGGSRLAAELEVLARVAALRDAPGGSMEWAPRAMRGLLAAAGEGEGDIPNTTCARAPRLGEPHSPFALASGFARPSRLTARMGLIAPTVSSATHP
jgi:hypothetical protein